ncbi:hypothetical protein BPC006_II1604 [Burkholderia pseudomallei BPC006]|nr:hypothetical protein BPC006_II1604 [Burkholderia pseudomallei BPC006]
MVFPRHVWLDRAKPPPIHDAFHPNITNCFRALF